MYILRIFLRILGFLEVLTRQADGADVADLDEVSVAEAGGPVVHMDRRRQDELGALL